MTLPSSPRPLRIRRRALITLTAGAVASLAACTDDLPLVSGGDGGSGGTSLAQEAPATAVLPADDLPAAALALTTALYEKAEAVVVATEGQVDALAPLAAEHRLPLLIGTDRPVVDELERLGASTLVAATGTDLSALGSDAESIEVDPSAPEGIPEVDIADAAASVTLFVEPGDDSPVATLARAVVEGAGGTVTEIAGADPRSNGDTVAAAKEATGEDPSTGVLAVGEGFGSTEDLTAHLRTAVTAPELPGGGQIAFPGRRMIAAYGAPGSPALGIMGEQPLPEAIERVKQLAADYEGLADEPVIPAFEIITTVASADPGRDGDYSNELDPALIREWVDAAGEAGVYCVLDLQPGTTDFLTQAKLYEDILREPHVGLALDPEWRLKPGQKHMVQIGSVTAAEVNEVITWLADIVAEDDLPQKVFILHQFNLSMISDRQDVDTSREELAITLHADGHGDPGSKMATWNALQKDLPEGIFMAWKNFYDEDTPTFTPEETYAVEPRPWFVSYQ